MAKRPTALQRAAQASKAAKAERNKQIKTLKGLGLVRKNQNLKNPTVRRNLLSKYRNVLIHKATVVTVPKGLSVKYKKSFRVVGNKIVVPRVKGERVHVEASGRITSTRKVGGERVKRILHVGGKMPKPAKGKKFMYAVPFTGGTRVRFDSFEALQEFMAPYHSFKNWKDYLEIEEIDADDDGDDE